MQSVLTVALFLLLSFGGIFAQSSVSGKVRAVGSEEVSRDSSSVVVWLEPTDGTEPQPAQPRKYRLTQKNKHFSPHLLVVPVGASVQFPNRDPFFHNVFSVYNGTRFDLGLYESGSSKLVKFTRPGPSYIFCNIHPEMSAVVLALNTTYFAVSDTNGNYEIKNVPAGDYELHLWSERARPERLRELQRKVTVPADGLRLEAIDISEAPSIAEHHKNKFGKDYEPAPTYKLP